MQNIKYSHYSEDDATLFVSSQSGYLYKVEFDDDDFIVNNITGKTTFEHVTAFLDPTDEFEGDLKLILEDGIKNAKKDFEQVVNKAEKKL